MELTITLTYEQADLLIRLTRREYHMVELYDVELVESCQAILAILDTAIGDELATLDAGE